jgi:mono/diheme cytochrome c family protein
MLIRILLPLWLAIASGCSDDREVREWRPGDHDRSDENQVAARGASAAEGAQVATDVLYRQHCTACHARDGSAKTPMASQMRIKDLRQSTLTEAEVVRVISKGRGRMPAFAEALDAEAIQSLADKVIAFRQPTD